MSNIAKAFESRKALIAFLTAGVVDGTDTVKYVLEMEKAGADIIELGVPFSDPVADGPIVLEADLKALKKGVHLPQVMDIAKKIREYSDIPLVFLTYYNPVFRYGGEKFFHDAKMINLDGILIPDLPIEEQGEIRPFTDKNGIDIIQVSASVSKVRIDKIADNAKGFISVMPTLGTEEPGRLLREICDVPVAVSADDAESEDISRLLEIYDGIIVGNKIVDIINKKGRDGIADVRSYLTALRKCM